MCVIIVAENEFPSHEICEAADFTNDDGIGLAWIEGDKVFWDKGIDLKDLQYYKYWTKGPWILHFRLRTDGPIGTPLCHPFTVDRDASIEASGSADSVLFHNGINREAFSLMKKIKQKPPAGDWSDSRAMAWLAGLTDCEKSRFEFFMNTKEKLAYLTKEGFRLFGNGWSKYKGFWVSNKNFLWRTSDYDYRDDPEYPWGYGYEGGAGGYMPASERNRYHEVWCRDDCYCDLSSPGDEDPPTFAEEWCEFVENADENHYLSVVEYLASRGITDNDMSNDKLSDYQIEEIRNLIYEDDVLEGCI